MTAKEMEKRIFQYMLIVCREEEEQKQRDEKEDRGQSYSTTLALGKVLALKYLLGYLELTEKFQKWSEEHEKNKNS